MGHLYEGEKSFSGYDDDKFWRSTRDYMSYQLSNKNLDGQFLDISALNDIQLDSIDISINENPAEIISTQNRTIRIKLGNTEIVNIKISSTNNTPTPRFYELRILKG